MWLDDKRVKFLDENDKKNFFRELRQKSKRNYSEIATDSKIPIGRLRLYKNSTRSLPKSLFNFWIKNYSIEIQNYRYKILEKTEMMSEKGKEGQKVLQIKYGRQWLIDLGKQRMENMRKDFENNPKLRRKWRKSIKKSLIEKYGKNCYHEMGLLGGRRAIEMADKEELRLRLKKAFRKSFKSKILFDGNRFRSMKEVEVAKLLVSRDIKYEYEKETMGFYPDFVLSNKIIIEVVGMDWKPHIERTRNKIIAFNKAGFEVIIYTYPNMIKFFDDLGVKVFTNTDKLRQFIGYNRG